MTEQDDIFGETKELTKQTVIHREDLHSTKQIVLGGTILSDEGIREGSVSIDMETVKKHMIDPSKKEIKPDDTEPIDEEMVDSIRQLVEEEEYSAQGNLSLRTGNTGVVGMPEENERFQTAEIPTVTHVERPRPSNPDTVSEEEAVRTKEQVRAEEPDNAFLKFILKYKIALGVVVAAIVCAAAFATSLIEYNKKQSYDYNLNAGNQAYMNHEYQNAIGYFEKAEETTTGKGNIELLYKMADCYQNLNEIDKATDILRQLLKQQENYADAIKMLSKIYYDDRNGNALNEMISQYRGSESEKYLTQYEVSEPVFSSKGGKYEDALSLEITADNGNSIYYTLDGREANTSGLKYNDPISLTNGKTTIKAVAVNEIGVISNQIEETYEISYRKPDAPNVSPASGTFEKGEKIVITNLSRSDRCFYTLDGSEPTSASTEYAGPIEIPDGNTIFSAIIISNHDLASSVTRRNYIVSTAKTLTYDEALSALRSRMTEKGELTGSDKTTTGETVTFSQRENVTLNGVALYCIQVTIAKAGATESTVKYFGCGITSGKLYQLNVDGVNVVGTEY